MLPSKTLFSPLYVKQKSAEEKRRQEVQLPSEWVWETKYHLEAGLFSTMPVMFLATLVAKPTFRPVGSEDLRLGSCFLQNVNFLPLCLQRKYDQRNNSLSQENAFVI